MFAKELMGRRTELVDDLLQMNDARDRGQDALRYVRERAQLYPLPVRDSLRIAADLEHLSRRTSEFAEYTLRRSAPHGAPSF
ncbi:hypothetical protein [Haliangium sp.]|uniref:hypothetical protein n=1 Tax=Haliangium sp. TaxID=2663208 RepID=UPI003D10F94A